MGYYNVAPIIEKTFNIMGITNYSKIYTSEEAAIKALT
jgi:anti-anti-sigma regulatory factor